MIVKERKKLEGEGDRDKAVEVAKGEAAPIREKGFAEAQAKDKLQAALNKFKPDAITAMVAEQIVAKDEKIGVETAKALQEADLKVFSGGKSGEQGFDLAQMITSTSVGNQGTADALLNKMARPNDLGLSTLGLKSVKENLDKKKKPEVAKDEDKPVKGSKQPQGAEDMDENDAQFQE